MCQPSRVAYWLGLACRKLFFYAHVHVVGRSNTQGAPERVAHNVNACECDLLMAKTTEGKIRTVCLVTKRCIRVQFMNAPLSGAENSSLPWKLGIARFSQSAHVMNIHATSPQSSLILLTMELKRTESQRRIHKQTNKRTRTKPSILQTPSCVCCLAAITACLTQTVIGALQSHSCLLGGTKVGSSCRLLILRTQLRYIPACKRPPCKMCETKTRTSQLQLGPRSSHLVSASKQSFEVLNCGAWSPNDAPVFALHLWSSHSLDH